MIESYSHKTVFYRCKTEIITLRLEGSVPCWIIDRPKGQLLALGSGLIL
jgi:hypothetical protein